MTSMGIPSLFKSCSWALAGAALLISVLTGCTTPAVESQVRPVDAVTAKRLDGAWVAVVGEDRVFQFNGEYRDSKTQQGYQMLYPAPNFVGFLAGVATHAALQSAQNDAHLEAQRKLSDQVLTPYRQVLDKIRVHEVFGRALQMSKSGAGINVAEESKETALPEVTLAAHAIMAQSRRALIVDLVAKVGASSEHNDTIGYIHKVRVISDAIEVSDNSVSDYWLADDGRQLKQTVSSLLAQAIDLFAADATRQFDSPDQRQITARYQFGNGQRRERAVVLEQTCSRQTLRTLRGWVLSVPVLDSHKGEAQCRKTNIATSRESPPA